MLTDFERLLMPTNTLKMLTFNFYISVVACLKLDLPQPYIMNYNTQQLMNIKFYPTHMISLH